MLISRRLDVELLRSGLGHGVDYRPESSDQCNEVISLEVDSGVWVADDRLSELVLDSWRQRVLAGGHRPVIVAAAPTQSLRRMCADREVELLGPVDVEGTRPRDLALLAAAEQAEQRASVEPRWRGLGIGQPNAKWSKGRSVSLVGAGVVNLVTAFSLLDAGFRVDLIEAAADPRESVDWKGSGATVRGENARMFCFTEADNYNERGDRAYTDMLSVFERRITEGGWLVHCDGTSGSDFQVWLDYFKSVAAWRAKVFADDIYRFNRASAPLWERMRRGHPALFTNAGYTEGVVRIYSESEALEAAIVNQARIGALRRVLTTSELGRSHPHLAAVCESDAIAGAIEVVGFTVNIHSFVYGLIDCLERRGARFRWRTRVLGWLREGDVVSGLRLDDRTEHTADHYVASPGAYGNELLSGTRCEGLLAGVAGLWLTMPNLEPKLNHSLKIHREGHVGEDANVTVAHDRDGRDTLILGSGYAVVGYQHELDLGSPDACSLYSSLTETVRRFFPRQYALGPEVGWRISPRACVRPFTPTGLGLFDGMPAVNGLALLTGGHNTGGFAQAPAVAEAVTNTLGGCVCEMQLKYEPGRGLA